MEEEEVLRKMFESQPLLLHTEVPAEWKDLLVCKNCCLQISGNELMLLGEVFNQWESEVQNLEVFRRSSRE